MATTQDPKTVAFVLYPGITLLDMVDPLQVFSVLGGFNDQYQPVVVAERIEPMPTDTPLTVTADKTFADVPDPTVVIVPGGGPPTMALALAARLTDEPTARMVQLWIEYDPHPPFGGIDWAQVDRDMAEPQVAQRVRTQLADRPELLAKLTG